MSTSTIPTPRPIASIDRNLTTCRARLRVERDPIRCLILNDLIEGLLDERREAVPACRMCQGKGKALANGQCARCDRRRCLYRRAPGDTPCTEVIEDPSATRCRLGHFLP